MTASCNVQYVFEKGSTGKHSQRESNNEGWNVDAFLLGTFVGRARYTEEVECSLNF